MDYSYIAGFFDGEGSAMALTIRRNINGRIVYRIRPVIKIAQNTIEILEKVKDTLGYGTIVKSDEKCNALQINGNKNIIKFVDAVGKYSFLKQRQLILLKELAEYQEEYSTNTPYTYESMEHMIDLRDKVFEANTWTRSRIKQKYSKEQILDEHEFIDIEEWGKKRQENGKNALNDYAKSIKKSRALIPCACGCGQLIEQHDSKGRLRKYVRGHNSKKYL